MVKKSSGPKSCYKLRKTRMKNNYLSVLMAVLFSLLLGCQSTTGQNLFGLSPSNQNLNEAVHTAFLNNPELAAVPIHIETQKGTVVLSGYVKTIRQSDTAFDIASKTPGV